MGATAWLPHACCVSVACHLFFLILCLPCGRLELLGGRGCLRCCVDTFGWLRRSVMPSDTAVGWWLKQLGAPSAASTQGLCVVLERQECPVVARGAVLGARFLTWRWCGDAANVAPHAQHSSDPQQRFHGRPPDLAGKRRRGRHAAVVAGCLCVQPGAAMCKHRGQCSRHSPKGPLAAWTMVMRRATHWSLHDAARQRDSRCTCSFT